MILNNKHIWGKYEIDVVFPKRKNMTLIEKNCSAQDCICFS